MYVFIQKLIKLCSLQCVGLLSKCHYLNTLYNYIKYSRTKIKPSGNWEWRGKAEWSKSKRRMEWKSRENACVQCMNSEIYIRRFLAHLSLLLRNRVMNNMLNNISLTMDLPIVMSFNEGCCYQSQWQFSKKNSAKCSPARQLLTQE